MTDRGVRRLVLLLALAAPLEVRGQDAPPPAPFGSQITEQRIVGYDRVMPSVATSAPLEPIGITEAKRLGFRTIVDLRPTSTSSADEEARAEFARIGYVNLPLAGPLPTEGELAALAAVLDDGANLPVLIHAADLDQVGAVWALFRAGRGVPAEIAILDGVTAGLGPSVDLVRERLAAGPPVD